jgi:Bacterial PH domain
MTTADGTGGSTIAMWEPRVSVFSLLACLGGVIVAEAMMARPNPLDHLSPLAAAVYLALAVLAVGCYRAWRMAPQFDDQGVTVRNLFCTLRIGWPQVSRFADGSSWAGGGSGSLWALVVVRRDGRAVTATATRGSSLRTEGIASPKIVTAIRQAAERYGVSTDGMTGRRPAITRSSRR